MRQELTILIDSFRLLQARKLFWVALGISALVAVIYASIGFTETGISLFFGLREFDNPVLRHGTPEAAAFYLLLFTDVIVRFWLAWFAVILALVATSSVFPEFLREGAIEVLLSKPIGRVRLLVWKYLGSLMFVAVQVALFAVIAFIAIGLRLGEWNLTIFWSVPLVTFVFSLVYCVAVLIGVVTRSTLFSLLGALLFWGATLVVQWSEDLLYQVSYMMPQLELELDLESGQVRNNTSQPGDGPLASAHATLKTVAAPLPKTRDCTLFLKRLIRFEGRQSALAGMDFSMLFGAGLPENDRRAAREAVSARETRHSTAYVVWSSLAFEVVVIGLAAAWFSRRDY